MKKLIENINGISDNPNHNLNRLDKHYTNHNQGDVQVYFKGDIIKLTKNTISEGEQDVYATIYHVRKLPSTGVFLYYISGYTHSVEFKKRGDYLRTEYNDSFNSSRYKEDYEIVKHFFKTSVSNNNIHLLKCPKCETEWSIEWPTYQVDWYWKYLGDITGRYDPGYRTGRHSLHHIEKLSLNQRRSCPKCHPETYKQSTWNEYSI